MKPGLVLYAAGLVLIAAAPALHGDPKVDFPGYLMPDTSCPPATHVLVAACPPNAPSVYVAFPEGKNVSRWIGRLVSVRGTIDDSGTCALPLVQATRIGDNPVFTCPPALCNPGDPPPCP
jgi:hypothetical protein